MMNKIRKLREKKGFTLVELIVVIAIIAILTAVLVPLINNWTQQAAYTTLDDSAQTVSNSINEAISKIVAGGAPLSSSVTYITGKKTTGGANKLDIKVEGMAAALQANSAPASGTSFTTLQKVAVEIATMLDSTIPNTCCFIAKISNGAVAGVIYVTAEATTFDSVTAAPADTTIAKVTNFNGHEYTSGTATVAVGATGEYKKY